jgi:[acyl-carrier-protein] S-malonyltransferase
MVAFIFPGQGSQAVGMGKALAEAHPIARRTFEEADDALGYSISRLCFEGPEEELKRTEITQPAILTASIAMYRVFAEKKPELVPTHVAGHSLGEFSALVAAGAFEFRDAVKLVSERGRLMQLAVPLGEGAMAAVLSVGPEVVTEACKKVEAEMNGAVVRAANFNAPEQTVISGAKPAVDAASRALSEAGAKIMALPVSAPFHCPMMEPAARGLEKALEPITLGALKTPVVTNVEAAANSDVARVKKLLVEQVTAPVRWVEIVRFLVGAGVTEAIEIGPGKVLAGLAKRIDKTLKVSGVEEALRA